MLGLVLFLMFTVLPALELYVLIKVGGIIGPWQTLGLVILIGIIGAFLSRIQGFLVLRKIQESMARGQMPTDAMIDGLLVLLGGLLLITPGFITDIFGIFFLFPPTRYLIRLLVSHNIKKMMHNGQIITVGQSGFGNPQTNKQYDDIDI